MSRREDSLCLEDIKTAIDKICIFIQDIDYSDFLKDEKTHDAVIRNLEIIGEASKNLSDEFKLNNQEIPWSDLAKVRDKLIYHYFGVNFDVVWDIITNDLPDVYLKIELILLNQK